jgi:uncharacterized membrane-anchored protein
MKHTILLLFFAVCAAQWIAPLSMITGAESTLAKGKVYKFRTTPLDPTDPFRGSYITLRFRETSVQQKANEKWQAGESIYLMVKEDANGFAKIQEGTLTKPAGDATYFKAMLEYEFDDQRDSFNVELPFQRYYLEESKASEAEKAYWEKNRENKLCYAVVAIRDGNVVLKDVMIENKSIVDIVKALRKDK